MCCFPPYLLLLPVLLGICYKVGAVLHFAIMHFWRRVRHKRRHQHGLSVARRFRIIYNHVLEDRKVSAAAATTRRAIIFRDYRTSRAH